MASIREKGPYQWAVQIRRKGWPNQSATFRTKKDAQAWARKVESEMDRGLFIDQSAAQSTTLADLIEIYLRDVTVDVPRLRHLLWSGYVREATRVVKNMLYQLEQHRWLRDASQKLKRSSVLISNLQTYLVQNTTSIVDYCNRDWSGQPISRSPAESAANSLVNARMNKKRQMRWSPAGAHRVLQSGRRLPMVGSSKPSLLLRLDPHLFPAPSAAPPHKSSCSRAITWVTYCTLRRPH